MSQFLIRGKLLIHRCVVLSLLMLGSLGAVQAQDATPPAADAPVTAPAEADAVDAVLSTAFTYQGLLHDGGSPANGQYDLQFRLFDAASGGAQIGAIESKEDLPVSGGQFTTDLDFGAGAFNGQARWLEAAVRPGASTGAYRPLAPRRALLAVPYAQYSAATRGLSVADNGNIGIGTRAYPDTQLVVAGQINSIAPNGAIGVNNPGNYGAYVSLSWKDNVGRIRVGGNGTGAANGLDIQSQGDVSLMRVSGNGNVGIGTTAPSQRLHVQGSAANNTGMLVVGNQDSGTVAEFRYPGTLTGGIRIAGDARGLNSADYYLERGTLLVRNNIAGQHIALLTANEQGNVGINSPAPRTTLEVHNGTLLVSGTAAQGEDTARLVVDTGASTGHAPLELRNANGVLVRVTGDGTTSTRVLQITGGADVAEPFAVTGRPEPGLVVSIDPDHVGQLRVADVAYDRTVAGVISGAGGLKPGLIMQQPEVVQGETHPVALTGRVYVWADAGYGAIEPGDLLTTSDTPGHAMRVDDYERAQGAILGKAMSELPDGTGLVLALVSLQ